MNRPAKAPSFGPSTPRATYRLKLLLSSLATLALVLSVGVSISAAAPTAPEIAKAGTPFEPSNTSVSISSGVNPRESRITDCHFVYGIGSPSGNTAPCTPTPAHLEVNERQVIGVTATSGQFKLSFESETTPDISYPATATIVQAALEGLASIGPGNISVTGSENPSKTGTAYSVTFENALAGKNVPQIQAGAGTIPLDSEVLVNAEQDGNPDPVPGNSGNEQLRVLTFPDSGQYKLSFESETTADILVCGPAEEFQSALEALPAIGSGNLFVQRTENTATIPGDRYCGYLVIFIGALEFTDVPELTVTEGTAPLRGRAGVVTKADGSINTVFGVSAQLSGLTPDSEYHYKLVATNGVGTSEGGEGTFRTLITPEVQGACPNQAIREEQRLFPSECRAFEMVSPLDKNGANVVGEGTNVVAATDGSAAVFSSRGGFAGTVGAGRAGFTQYLSRRGAGGWSTKPITPTPPGDAAQVFNGGTEIDFFSDDLRKAVLWGFDMPQRDDDVAHNDNLYREDTDSGALETVTLSAQQQGAIGFNDYSGKGETWGASADTGVVSFASKTKLMPEATAAVRNAYEWDHGTLRLAGFLPNGEVPAGGSTPPMFGQQGYRATVSSDGSRLIFASPVEGNQQLYLRRNHTNTVWITEPESDTFAGEPEGVELQWVSPDAHKILFTTSSKLLEDDENDGSDLYLYTDGPNPQSETGNLKLITKVSDGYGVWGASDDASRIYFGRQTGRLQLWDEGEIRTITSGSNGPAFAPMTAPGFSRVSADGRYLVFREGPDPATVDGSGLTRRDVNGTEQMYVYDAVGNTLACASCATDGPTTGEIPEEPQVNVAGARKNVTQLRPRFLSEDGSRVFFSTTTALVPEDTNEAMDTYLYNTKTGQQQLLSSGKGTQGQWFVNASASGDDAFFVTNEAMVGADGDELADLYDSRIGGGFVEPPPPPTPCVGDGCRGSLTTPPGGASPSTSSFTGPGNRHRKANKHKKRQKKHRHSSKGHAKKGARR